MSFKGEDLDIRVPQVGLSSERALVSDTESALQANGSRFRTRPGIKATTVWVDEVLMQCSNHAYEVAGAHGAPEVMVEHLLYAMTRVPESALSLEARGVDVPSLRRETAAAISSEIPLAMTPGTAKLNASPEFEATIVAASAHARLRAEKAAAPRDVLFALLEVGRDTVAVDLLKRHWRRWSQEEAADRLGTRPQPVETPLVPRYESQPAVPVRDISDRLSTLEAGLSGISAEMQRERGEIRELVGGIRDALSLQRTDAHGGIAALAERFARLEKQIDAAARQTSAIDVDGMLGARLARLDKVQDAVLAQRSAFAGLEQAVSDRLARLETALQGASGARPSLAELDAVIGPRFARVEKIQEAVLAQRASLANVETALGERLQRLEQAISAARMPAEVGDKIAALERTLDGRLAEVTTRANTASERLQTIDKRIEEGQRSHGGLVERLVGIERSLGAQRAELAHLQTAVSQDLETVVASAKVATSGALESALDQRFERISGAIDAQGKELRQAVPAELQRHISSLQTTLSQRVDSLELGLAVLQEASTGLNRQIETERSRSEDAIARLHGAQQTLSAAVDQWRKDNGMRLESIATAVGGMHGAGARTAELLESQAGRLEILSGEVHEVTKIQRASLRQRGFWRWLFGLR